MRKSRSDDELLTYQEFQELWRLEGACSEWDRDFKAYATEHGLISLRLPRAAWEDLCVGHARRLKAFQVDYGLQRIVEVTLQFDAAHHPTDSCVSVDSDYVRREMHRRFADNPTLRLTRVKKVAFRRLTSEEAAARRRKLLATARMLAHRSIKSEADLVNHDWPMILRPNDPEDPHA